MIVKLIRRTLKYARRIVKKNTAAPFIMHQTYGKIYMPQYNHSAIIESTAPTIYNAEGKPMDSFFLRDIHSAHCPERDNSKYFLWNRYNIGLETHFYSHQAMLETMGTPNNKYGLLVEAPDIVPNDYYIFNKNKGLENEFSAIFTYDDRILNSLTNAKFYPSCATIWYGKNIAGLSSDKNNESIKIHDKTFELKTKNISMVCSDKKITEFHKIRHAYAEEAQKLGVDIFGKFNGGIYLNDKSESLEKYRYQITIENGISPYYFTEKIMDCFASMTIPIYLGASKINDFFNAEGIIKIGKENYNNLDKILAQCTEKEYLNRLPAIIDNYNRSLKYLNMNDYLYENYFMN